MKKIGITGGIGAGKSLICEVFNLLGVPNYPADYRAKWLQSNDPELKKLIVINFGNEAYLNNGELNREYLSKAVFNDDKKLKTLNGLVHPAVAKDFEYWCDKHSDKAYVLKEAALLYETGSYKQLDATINVHANQELRIERTLKRDPQRTKESVLSIMNKQFSDQKRLNLADHIIYNDESRSVILQVIKLHEELVNL
ncbi:dephospho-CoA kinase [Marivirga arenosa]|uniref:Dephospho-CoA kinase n=1 Tax=Marivirga arenosa TaxID=3059076 RepID=A0AA51R9G5_9BACT|nr:MULTISPECIES: dephospho-CoA kinase [unclassified Marivirga]WMN07611.1 dephospho-CoA kinase [Marivirga sp. ABR2-2]WNB18182.1 dephospho-CoA kinase [Marivirga sp. BKB1-2]